MQWMLVRSKRSKRLQLLAKLLVALTALSAPRCFRCFRFVKTSHTRHPLPLTGLRAGAENEVSPTWARQHQLGDIVEVRCEDDGDWYQAVVEHEFADGTFMVRFDREGYEYHYPLTCWRVPKIRHSIAELEEGEMLQGRVTDISSLGFYVDIGAEEEGFVHRSDMRDGVNRVADEVQIGQDVQVRVLSNAGKLNLSMKPMRSGDLAAFQNLPSGTLLKVTIKEIDVFGAFADVQPPQVGVPYRGLIHKSNMGRFVVRVEDVVSLGQEVHVAVLSTDNDRLSLVLNATEDISYFESLSNETWIDATVEAVARFGAFLAVHCPRTEEKKIGLLPASEMADFFVEDPTDFVSVGESLLVRVVSIQQPGKLILSAKPIEIEVDLEPFQPVARQDHFLSGVVQTVSRHGAYVVVQPPHGGIACRGFVTKADMELDGRMPEEVVEVGQDVHVRVLSASRGRLMLSMLPFTATNISSDVWLKGVVKEVVDFGAFVEAEVPDQSEVLRGLVHISEIGDGYVESVSAVLQVDQEVDVRVKDIRTDGKVGLTMREPEVKAKKLQASSTRADLAEGTQKANEANVSSSTAQGVNQGIEESTRRAPLAVLGADEWLPAVVKEVGPFGAKLEVTDPETSEAVYGWVHISEASDGLLVDQRVSDVLRAKQKVRARVLKAAEGDGDVNVSFSLRSAPEPLEPLELKTSLHGTVENVSLSGAFLRISQNGGDIVGFLPSSEVDAARTGAEGCLSEGQEVDVYILAAGADRLALTTRPPDTSSSLVAFATSSPHMWFQGVVQQATPVGLFAVLQPPGGGAAVKGFVHISELDEHVKADIAVGDSIRVRVLDASSGRLQLSMRHVRQP